MKNRLEFILTGITICIVLSTEALKAQVLEDLRAPSMPAATIIGTQINEISTPKSLRALETAVLNNFIDPNGNAMIPNNYAIEIDPFMLSKRENFDYLTYLSDSIRQNLWRHLSFSVASTNKLMISDSVTGSALGFGGRTMILNGKVNQKLEKSYKDKLKAYKNLLDAESTLLTMAGEYNRGNTAFCIDSLKFFLTRNIPDSTGLITALFENIPKTAGKENIKAIISDLLQPRKGIALNDLKKAIESVKTERFGWRWELDAALSLSFPTNNFNYCISPKYGIWSNLSYRPFKKDSYLNEGLVRIPGNFEFIGLFRWIDNNDDFIHKFKPVDTILFNSGRVFDLGVRAVYELKKFSLELEFICRLNQNVEYITIGNKEYSRYIKDQTCKYVLNLNYNLSENMVFSYNIGKNYDNLNTSNGNLISGFTLSFGFGGVKADDLIDAVKRNN
jgi:hypothetical protein